MKKLLLVLLVVAMAAFLFVGCLPTTPPAEGEGEGEGETVVTVEIEGAVRDIELGNVVALGQGEDILHAPVNGSKTNTIGVSGPTIGGL